MYTTRATLPSRSCHTNTMKLKNTILQSFKMCIRKSSMPALPPAITRLPVWGSILNYTAVVAGEGVEPPTSSL